MEPEKEKLLRKYHRIVEKNNQKIEAMEAENAQLTVKIEELESEKTLETVRALGISGEVARGILEGFFIKAENPEPTHKKEYLEDKNHE